MHLLTRKCKRVLARQAGIIFVSLLATLVSFSGERVWAESPQHPFEDGGTHAAIGAGRIAISGLVYVCIKTPECIDTVRQIALRTIDRTFDLFERRAEQAARIFKLERDVAFLKAMNNLRNGVPEATVFRIYRGSNGEATGDGSDNNFREDMRRLFDECERNPTCEIRMEGDIGGGGGGIGGCTRCSWGPADTLTCYPDLCNLGGVISITDRLVELDRDLTSSELVYGLIGAAVQEVVAGIDRPVEDAHAEFRRALSMFLSEDITSLFVLANIIEGLTPIADR